MTTQASPAPTASCARARGRRPDVTARPDCRPPRTRLAPRARLSPASAPARPTLRRMPRRPPAVLSIAGSDSGGGAGIQADLKAFARCGVHGMTAIAALTAQNTVGVTGVHTVPAAFIVEQVRAVAEDIGVDAVKIGMLGTAETVEAVARALELLEDGVPVVIDPVMVAESGAVLLDDAARQAMIELLLPLATVITPNLPEARVLAGEARGGTAADGVARGRAAGRSEAREGTADGVARGGAAGRSEAREGMAAGGVAREGMAAGGADGGGAAAAEDLARALHALGPANVVVTGGHREEATDVFFDGTSIELIPGHRHPDGAAHGSGCTHSSALAAHLALGYSPIEAARAAKRIAGEAVRDGLRNLGAGPGPVDVFDLQARAKQSPASAEVAR